MPRVRGCVERGVASAGARGEHAAYPHHVCCCPCGEGLAFFGGGAYGGRAGSGRPLGWSGLGTRRPLWRRPLFEVLPLYSLDNAVQHLLDGVVEIPLARHGVEPVPHLAQRPQALSMRALHGVRRRDPVGVRAPRAFGSRHNLKLPAREPFEKVVLLGAREELTLLELPRAHAAYHRGGGGMSLLRTFTAYGSLRGWLGQGRRTMSRNLVALVTFAAAVRELDGPPDGCVHGILRRSDQALADYLERLRQGQEVPVRSLECCYELHHPPRCDLAECVAHEMAVGGDQYADVQVAASVMHSSLPACVFSQADTDPAYALGWILRDLDADKRGPAFPHDAWGSYAKEGRKCLLAGHPVRAYAERRRKILMSIQRRTEKVQYNRTELGMLYKKLFGYSIRANCWVDDWSLMVSMAKEFVESLVDDGRFNESLPVASFQNEVRVRYDLADIAAIFYVNASTGPGGHDNASLSLRQALRVSEAIGGLRALNGSSATGPRHGPLPVLEFRESPVECTNATAVVRRTRAGLLQPRNAAFRALRAQRTVAQHCHSVSRTV